jgi:ATP-binding cassette subfamily B protein
MQSEFSIKLKWAPTRRDDATRWVLAHALRNKIWIVVMLIGAIGNAAGAALMPVFIGQAFNAVVNTPIDYAVIGAAAIGIVVSQVVRAVLQLGRNFGCEIIGQRLERDTRTSCTPACSARA